MVLECVTVCDTVFTCIQACSVFVYSVLGVHQCIACIQSLCTQCSLVYRHAVCLCTVCWVYISALHVYSLCVQCVRCTSVHCPVYSVLGVHQCIACIQSLCTVCLMYISALPVYSGCVQCVWCTSVHCMDTVSVYSVFGVHQCIAHDTVCV